MKKGWVNYSKNMSRYDIAKWFGVDYRTVIAYDKYGINLRKIYNAFHNLRTIREMKTYLYKDVETFSYAADLADKVWNKFIDKYYEKLKQMEEEYNESNHTTWKSYKESRSKNYW